MTNIYGSYIQFHPQWGSTHNGTSFKSFQMEIKESCSSAVLRSAYIFNVNNVAFYRTLNWIRNADNWNSASIVLDYKHLPVTFINAFKAYSTTSILALFFMGFCSLLFLGCAVSIALQPISNGILCFLYSG